MGSPSADGGRTTHHEPEDHVTTHPPRDPRRHVHGPRSSIRAPAPCESAVTSRCRGPTSCEARWRAFAQSGHVSVLLDLQDVRAADDAGLQVLRAVRRDFAATGGELVVRHLPEKASRLTDRGPRLGAPAGRRPRGDHGIFAPAPAAGCGSQRRLGVRRRGCRWN
ncbi:STAS domain-containing protein [Blastococcus sp. CT_GayMR19]|nr:STAS domain-containing protein [Blastococcus sp. CT_GayMR19]